MNLLIIQARMGSTRLPGKVLKKINNKPCLLILMERALLAKKVDKIVIATTKKKVDKEIIKFCKKYNFDYFCGSEDDVLKRYYDCNLKYGGDTIIRITSDCPLVDPAVIDNTIDIFNKKKADYAANTIPPDTRRWPDGSDVEVFSKRALFEAFKKAKGNHREHVTFYFWQSTHRFRTVQLDNKYNWSRYRYTLDYEEDLIRLKKIIKILDDKKIKGSTKDIVDIIKNNIKENKIEDRFSFGFGWKKKKVKNQNKILFRADAGKFGEIGTGHVIRTLRLIEELILQNIFSINQITIAYRNFEGFELAKNIVKQFRYQIKRIEILSDNIEKEKEILINSKSNIVVFDTLSVRKELLLCLKEKNKFLISFDELGQGINIFDVIIYSLIKPKVKDKKSVYVGYEYLNLSTEIIKKSYIKKKPKIFVVSLGGNDKRKLLIKILEILKELPKNLKFIFIVSNNDYNNLANEVLKRKLRFDNLEILVNPKNFYSLASKADIAIVGGGLTLFEFAAMGIPTISIPQHKHQVENIKALINKNITNCPNINMTLKNKDLICCANDLIKNYSKRLLMHKQGIKFIDGKGLTRITKIFKNITNSYNLV